MELIAVRHRSLSDEVVDKLRTEIMEGRWRVGEKIPTETELMSALGVARGTVREALRSLQYSGLLEIRRGDGTYVRACSEVPRALERTGASLGDILEARGAIEPCLASLAAERATDRDITAIEVALEARSVAGDDTWVAADFAVHTAIAHAAHSPVLFEVYSALLPRLHGAMDAALRRPGFQRHDPRGHEDVLAAIRARDPRTAADKAAANLGATEVWDSADDTQ